MPTLAILEIAAGLVALIITAMAFTTLMWSEGASSGQMKKDSARKMKVLFGWAIAFWLLTGLLAYLSAAQAPPPAS